MARNLIDILNIDQTQPAVHIMAKTGTLSIWRSLGRPVDFALEQIVKKASENDQEIRQSQTNPQHQKEEPKRTDCHKTQGK